MEHTQGREGSAALEGKSPGEVVSDPHFLVVLIPPLQHFFEFSSKHEAQTKARVYLQARFMELENDTIYLLVTPVSPVTFMVVSKAEAKKMFGTPQPAQPPQSKARPQIVLNSDR